MFGFIIFTLCLVVLTTVLVLWINPSLRRKAREWCEWLDDNPTVQNYTSGVSLLLYVLAIMIALSIFLPRNARADGFDSAAYSPYAVSRVASSGVKAQRGVAVQRQAVGGGHVVLSSFYGGGERLNRHTASGAVFRPNGLSAAHRTLPLGTKVQLSLGGRTVIAVVNDRGPAAWTGRQLDVSKGVAASLGFVRAGTAHLTMVVLR